jgi:hypothetical protein
MTAATVVVTLARGTRPLSATIGLLGESWGGRGTSSSIRRSVSIVAECTDEAKTLRR